MSRINMDLAVRRGTFTLRVHETLEGPWVGVVGPSGAGKSTLLEAAAGLVPSIGRFEVEGRLLQDTASGMWQRPRERRVGYVFQGESLFPHLTVAANLSFGMGTTSTADAAARLREVADTFDLQPLMERRPPALSGGERRRVALGRALLRRPSVLLLDEPLTGLDPGLRSRILDYLARMRARFPVPALLVSHQLEDVLALADQIMVLEEGVVRARGPTLELLQGPDRSALERLVGFENVMELEVTEVDPAGGTVTGTGMGGVRIQLPPADVAVGRRVRVGIRAEDLILATRRPGPTSARNLLQGTVSELTARGPWTLVGIDCGILLSARLTPASCADLALRIGGKVWVLFKAHSCHYLDVQVVGKPGMKEAPTPVVTENGPSNRDL